MTNEPVDVEAQPAQEPTTAIVKASDRTSADVQHKAAEAKVDAIAALTHAAYAKASQLELTDQEIAKLSEPFPDEAFKPGAAGKENLIYIEHAFLRDRLNDVFRPGKWSIVPRSRWNENFKTKGGYNKEPVDACRIYVEAMLVIRGCFAAEAVGEMEYYPNNAGQNYGDAVEGAKTAALRRCCKELGIGLQAWKKDWCEGWWDRRRKAEAAKKAPGRAEGVSQPTQAPKQAPTPKREAAPARQTRAQATEAEDKSAKFARRCLEKFIGELERLGPHGIPLGWDYLVSSGKLLPTEDVRDLTIPNIPKTADDFAKIMNVVLDALQDCDAGTLNEVAAKYDSATKKGQPEKSAARNTPAPKPVEVPRDPKPHDSILDPQDEAWRDQKVPPYREDSLTLGELQKNKLFGWWANFQVETEYNGKPKKPESIARDKQFRAMLNEAGAHYNFQLNS